MAIKGFNLKREGGGMKKSNLFSVACALVILVSFGRSLYAEANEDISEGVSVSASIPWPTVHPSDAVYAQITWFDEVYDTYSWWENGVIWIDVIPVTTGPWICGASAVVQNGVQYSGNFLPPSGFPFCSDLYVPTIFALSKNYTNNISIWEYNPSYETMVIIGRPGKTIIVPPSSIPQSKNLTVLASSQGTVTSNPSGINCGSSCQYGFKSFDTIELTAEPINGWRFDHWSGDCGGSGKCILTMSDDKSVGTVWKKDVSFFDMTVSNDGGGSVYSEPSGIDCGSICNSGFEAGSTVTLVAKPNPTFRFKRWSGDCSGSKTSTCTLGMTKNMQVGAYFESAVPQKALTVSTKGSGTIYDSFGLIDCGDQCTASYNRGTKVQLTVTPDEGWKFKKWTGACTGKRACTVNLKANRKVTAVFVPQ